MSEQERKCENCEFFVTERKSDLAGDCRIRAPEPPVHKLGQAVWPQVERNQWCGEFRAKE